MQTTSRDQRLLRTSEGDFPLDEYRLKLGERELKILHVSAVLSREEETRFLLEMGDRVPYGVTLWASAVALAHEIGVRAEDFRGRNVLELGAGAGLPGIVAASLGARVVQTDRYELVMSVCRRNVALNGIETAEQRIDDWAEWQDEERYDWIIGSDILYAEGTHTHLRRIFGANLAPAGRILLSDPFRETGIRLLEALEKDGWSIAIGKWNIGEDFSARPVGVFELTPPFQRV